MTEILIRQKPIHWFALQTNGTGFYLIGTTVMKELSTNPIKWSSTLKQFARKLPVNRLSVFDNFVGLALKGLKDWQDPKDNWKILFS